MRSIIGYPIIHTVGGGRQAGGKGAEKPTIPLFYLLYNPDYILVHSVMWVYSGARYNRNLSPVSFLSHCTRIIGKQYTFAQNVMLVM